MKLALTAALLLLVVGCGPFGDDDDGAGKKACELYQGAMKEDPLTISDISTLDSIKSDLSTLDKETWRAFGALISASDANPFLEGADPNAVDEAAAKVRATCLSEHSVDIPN